jgi:hypothetical protein
MIHNKIFINDYIDIDMPKRNETQVKWKSSTDNNRTMFSTQKSNYPKDKVDYITKHS